MQAERLHGLSPDAWLLFATSSVRNFAYGFLSVMLGLYLSALGIEANIIGFIFTAALAGGAVMTVALAGMADRVGRRRVLLVGAALMGLAGVVFSLTNNPVLLAVAAILGTISPSGKEVGPFLSVEQATLSQTTDVEQRTGVFSAYNIASSLASALGAMFAGLPVLIGLDLLLGYRFLLWSYAAAALAMLLLFARLSSGVEAPKAGESRHTSRFGLHRSRGVVAKLATLFAVDAFAGGFVVQGLVAYWFHLRYGVNVETLAPVFFGTNILSAISFLAAAPVAKRIGLLNTMVFTHLPSNVLLMLVPLVPGFWPAVATLLVRNLLSQLDVPTRQSYTMAVVDADERSAAAGFTSVARNSAAAIAPAFAGATLAVPAAGLPFLLAGGLKIVYDLTLMALFRNVQPIEGK